MMNEYGRTIPYNTRNRMTEAMEERGLSKGNSFQGNASRTQGRIHEQSALERIRQWRHNLKQEPYEVVPHVRICAGGAG